MRIYLSGRSVLVSGSITFQKDEIPSIRPFEDDPDYAVEFRVSVVHEGKTTVAWRGEGEKTAVIEIVLNLTTDGNEIAPSNPLVVAEVRDAVLAFMNLAVRIIGESNKYTCIINYTIYEAERANG